MIMKNSIAIIFLLLGGWIHTGPAGGNPVILEYSTYLGGSGSDSAWAAERVDDGSLQLVGATSSSDFPTTDPYQPLYGGGGDDAFISHLSASGSSLLRSTFLGGLGSDRARAIYLDSSGCAYLCGETDSDAFPTLDALQAGRAGGIDVFVSKFSSSGSTLLYSTYLGGSGNDYGRALKVINGLACISGYSASSDFPTMSPFQASRAGGDDVFLSIISATGSALITSTYIGGSATDRANDIALDDYGTVYLAGYTESSNFPTINSYQAGRKAWADAFISTFSSSGSALIYSTYLGGDNYDFAKAIRLDEDLCIYLAGNTFSGNFPLVSPYQGSRAGSYDVFLSKLSSSGTSLLYSSYLGGSDIDYLSGIRENYGGGLFLDSAGRAYLTGSTRSYDFPTLNPYQATFGGGTEDAFLTLLRTSGGAPIYSTYFGGGDSDSSHDVSGDGKNRAYFIGSTKSSDFPTGNSYQDNLSGEEASFSAYLRWITPTTPVPTASPTPSFTPTSTPTPSPTPSPDTCHTPFKIMSLEDADIYMTRSSQPHGWTYYFETSPDGADRWGSIDDNADAYVSYSGFTSPRRVRINIVKGGENFNIQTGDRLTAFFDGGQSLDIYLPRVTGSGPVRFYPDSVGNTYYDAKLCHLAQAAPGGETTPTPTPTPDLTPVPTPVFLIDSGDYDGDMTSDIAVFRPPTGLWAVRGLTRIYFGGPTDIPASADYAGGGTTAIAIFRPSSGLWAVRSLTRLYFGSAGDLPLPGDYDGDGCCEAGVFRASSGLWALRFVTRVYFGGGGDAVIPGDYDGDLIKDIAIFRNSNGLWALRNLSRIYFGGSQDIAVPGDYDGVGSWKAAVFRPASGLWAIRGFTRAYFGAASDRPVPADYEGTWIDQIGIFRENSGLWAIRSTTRVYFGTAGDIPVTR